MRGAWIRLIMWGALAGVLAWSPTAQAEGFWVTLAAGVAGASLPSDYSEFWFDTQHGPPLAIVSLNGSTTVQATTGGGTTVFSPLGTPVLLPTQDGYATLTPGNGSVSTPSIPNGALPRFAGSQQASGAPMTGLPVPPNSARLSLGVSPPTSNGSQVVTVDVTDSNGNSLGSGQINVPGGGWWVIGLGPDGNGNNSGGNGGSGDNGGRGGGGEGDSGSPPPIGPLPPPLDEDDSQDSGSPPPVGGTPGPPPPWQEPTGPVATPEPGSVLMVALGGLTVAGWRRRRRLRS